MKHLNKCFYLCLLIMLITFGVENINAQETLTISGGNAIVIGGSVSYTIGQVDYITNTSKSGTVTQGVL